MKNVKIVFWAIVACFIGILLYSNKDFFLAKQALSLKMPFLEPYYTPELANAVFFLAFFLIGFLIAYFFNLYERFKSKRTIKSLDAEAAIQREEFSKLKSELESIKGAAPSNDEASVAQSE